MNMAVDGFGEPGIRVVSRRLVKASDPSIQPHVVPLSNLDLYVGNVQVAILCLYPKLPAGRDFAGVVATFESLLPALLNEFYPFAGRIGTNPSSGLPELLCHNQGSELVVGEVGVALGSLDYGLADKSLKKLMLPYAEDVTFSVQLLSFACGNFSLLWATNHLVGDGHDNIRFLRMWSQLARTGKIVADGDGDGKLCHDRSVFRPRNPPSYRASLAADITTFDPRRLVNVLTAHDSFVDRLYYIEAADIASLREMASTEQRRSSRVQAVSAYLWKVLAGVVAASRVPEERCRMGWWVSARRRLTSPELASAMRNYFGNVTTYAYGDASVEEIQRKSLAEVAAMAREPVASVNYEEYIQDLVDFVEVHKGQGLMETPVVGLGSPILSQSVFDSFPLDTDFGFGQAALAMPISDFANLCSAYLSISAKPAGDGSWLVSAYIWPRLAAALEADEQHIFKPLTAEYLGLTAS
ncbi:putrescine hydroxycinnamoyltransferase 3-like [Triticum dicoccoides]|uniref:putrescine hydroxycinnamoyltransferase 3-like n=1 Tax=Triticum dicoccoides TaxID=85692 RepID=UPI00188F29EA|nr:putrescine hydroxycinnamoyltransferase 3-like [Triticum dicoccoides]